MNELEKLREEFINRIGEHGAEVEAFGYTVQEMVNAYKASLADKAPEIARGGFVVPSHDAREIERQAGIGEEK